MLKLKAKKFTISQLSKLTEHGHFIPAAINPTNGVTNKNCTRQKLLCTDIDNEDNSKLITPDEVISALKKKGLNVLGYCNTFNSSTSKPNFRVFFTQKF